MMLELVLHFGDSDNFLRLALRSEAADTFARRHDEVSELLSCSTTSLARPTAALGLDRLSGPRPRANNARDEPGPAHRPKVAESSTS